MQKFVVHIPTAFDDPESIGLDTRPRKLRERLNQLPLVNPEESAGRLLEDLHQISRAKLTPGQRHELLAIIQPVAEELSDTLRGKYARALLPLGRADLARLRLNKNLHAALVTGFETLIEHRREQLPENEHEDRILFQAIHGALHHLGLILLEHYTVYAPAPPGLWAEINRLYSLAEVRGAQNRAVHNLAADYPETASAAFRRAALLSLSNPYRLMQGEAQTIHRVLSRLVHATRLHRQGSEDGRPCFYLDLKADAPPRFALQHRHMQAFEPRYLDVSRLLQAVEQRIAALDQGRDEQIQFMSRYQRRLESDMLKRLRASWGRTRDRETPRVERLGIVTAVIGLSASHHFLTAQAPFTPELDEIRIHTGKHLEADSGLSLVPMDVEPWRLDEAEQRLQSGVENPRKSDFDVESKALDMWEKIYATRTKRTPAEELPPYCRSHWDQMDASAYGRRLYCKTDCSMPLRVGEVIALQADDGEGTWTIGSVRWLHIIDNESVDMGVMVLSTGARGVASRAIKGVGEGGEYFRALLAGAKSLDDPEATLIVPGAIYDLGSILAIGMGDRIRYVELTELLNSTSAFSHCRFRLVDIPDSETKNIDALRALL